MEPDQALATAPESSVHLEPVAHPNLAAALVAGLAELTVVDKGRTANAGSYKYEYADIADVIRESRPVLAEHGVVVLTPVCDNGDELACTVVFLHTSGERMDFGPFSFPRGRDAQATGSAVTYHRRYSLLAALGMATGDDDDGATAHPARRSEPQTDNPLAPGLRDRMLALPQDAQQKITAWFPTPPGEWESCSDEALGRLAVVLTKAEATVNAASTEPATIADEVRDRLIARIDALPDTPRHALEDAIAGAVGTRFPVGLVAADVPVVSALIDQAHADEGPTAADLAARAARRGSKTDAA